jgi:NADH-quinone oxidoreductase subunit M
MILAGVLLKMGGYGFIRFSLPMFPEASVALMWVVFGASMIAVVYTSLIALVQADMKKLIAYSSVAHMAFVTAGLFAFNTQGVEGAMVVMLSHGVVSAALFFCVGVIYDRLHTREIDRYGGVTTNMPRYAVFFLLFTMASIALPGTSGFVGEFLALTGVFKAQTWVAFVMATGVILGAAYMLWLFARVMFGAQKNEDAAAMPDMTAREWSVMVPLALVALWMGVYPKPFLQPLKAPVESLMARLERADAPQTPHTRLPPAGPVLMAAAESRAR